MVIDSKLVDAVKEWLGEEGLTFFRNVKEKHGTLNAVWIEDGIPHPVHGQWIKEQGDYRIKIRGRRNDLPTSWDDLVRRDWEDRTWKRHRRTQYHVD